MAPLFTVLSLSSLMLLWVKGSRNTLALKWQYNAQNLRISYFHRGSAGGSHCSFKFHYLYIYNTKDFQWRLENGNDIDDDNNEHNNTDRHKGCGIFFPSKYFKTSFLCEVFIFSLSFFFEIYSWTDKFHWNLYVNFMEIPEIEWVFPEI